MYVYDLSNLVFSQNYFSSKRSSGHLECSFDESAVFFDKRPDFSTKFLKIKNEINFLKYIILLMLLPWTSEMQMGQLCWNSFTKVLIKFGQKSKNDEDEHLVFFPKKSFSLKIFPRTSRLHFRQACRLFSAKSWIVFCPYSESVEKKCSYFKTKSSNVRMEM